VAISCCQYGCTIEIATLPPVARDDGGLMAQPPLTPAYCRQVSPRPALLFLIVFSVIVAADVIHLFSAILITKNILFILIPL